MESSLTSAQQGGIQDSHIKSTLSISPDEYMNDRVVYKINKYVEKSERQKIYYQVTSIVAIVFAASVPVLINLGVNLVLPTILSLVVTILVSLEKLFHFREHWRNYDTIASVLRREQLEFQTLSGVYKKKDSKLDDTFPIFVRRIEEAIRAERNDTIEMRTSEIE